MASDAKADAKSLSEFEASYQAQVEESAAKRDHAFATHKATAAQLAAECQEQFPQVQQKLRAQADLATCVLSKRVCEPDCLVDNAARTWAR